MGSETQIFVNQPKRDLGLGSVSKGQRPNQKLKQNFDSRSKPDLRLKKSELPISKVLIRMGS